jgi:hypothetical protein
MLSALVSISLSSDPMEELSKLYRLSKPKFAQPWQSEQEIVKVGSKAPG